jgi:chromosome segregation ATPase
MIDDMERFVRSPDFDARLVGLGLEDLESLAEHLLARIESIQAQTSDPNRTVEGLRQDPHEYHDWRHRAVGALRHSTRKYRAVRQRIRQLNVSIYNSRHRPGEFEGALGVLADAGELIRRRLDVLAPLDDWERSVLDAIRSTLIEARRARANGPCPVDAAVADPGRMRDSIRSTRGLIDPPDDDEEGEDET